MQQIAVVVSAGIPAHPHARRYSASQVTTLWRYTNLFIIIIIIIIIIIFKAHRHKAGKLD